MFLEAHFGDVELHMPEINPDEPIEDGGEPSFWVRLDDSHAQISLISMVTPIHLFAMPEADRLLIDRMSPVPMRR